MKIYRSKDTGALFYAEMPSANTSLEFIHEAALYDIYLFKQSGYDPCLANDWKGPFYNFRQNSTNIIISEKQYLLLPADEQIRIKYGKGAFLKVFNHTFEKEYEPLD